MTLPDSSDASQTLGVSHVTAYRYEAPVELAHHLCYLRPLHDAWQQVDDYTLVITPAPADYAESLDVFGNRRATFALYAPCLLYTSPSPRD